MRLLSVSTRSPFETLTGAAHNQRALLAGLARRGLACHALSSGDEPGAGGEPAALAWRRRGAIDHAVVGTRRLLDATEAALREVAPDAVMIWGPRELASEIVALAGRRGIPTVHQIRTPSIHHVERMGWDGTAPVGADERARLPAHRVADRVFVPSAFMAEYWAARLGVRPVVVHPVIEPDRVRTARRGARCVTFINPEPGKGLGVFWRLAAVAADRFPAVRFLVVEGRWTAAHMARAGIPALTNVRIIPNQRDVRRVWAATSVLLVPSVLPEGFALVVQEAQLNGIPVIASAIGGIPEAANGGGVLIAPPPRCVADWIRVPTATEIRPWIDALAGLVGDAGAPARARARRRAVRAAGGFPPARIIGEVAAQLRALAGAAVRAAA